MKGRKVTEQVSKAKSAQIGLGVEIVVLANGASASAAEIVTGALADNDRAKFVGTRTFGKGSVQQLKLLDGGQGALKMTSSFYYIPSGTKIHRIPEAEKWGVDPDDGFFVVMTPEQIEKMHKIRREGDILRRDGNGNGNGNGRVTADWIEQEMADIQLAAGMRTLQGKLETDQWPAVGEAGADLLAKRVQHDRLVRRRQLLREAMDEVEAELAKLDNPEEEGDKPEPGVVSVDTDAAPATPEGE